MALDEAPPFWWQKNSWQGYALSPVPYVYGKIAAKRMDMAASAKVNVPVICVGNFVVGGAGKTPSVHMLANYARTKGYKVGILSRGHGGAITTPTVVQLDKHNAHDVGDEALLHALNSTTVIASNRVAGAELLLEQACTIIIMDDGFQNPSLHKDFNLVAVDAKRGLGNGFAMPAGPMRVPFKHQLLHTDAMFITGKGDAADTAIRKAARAGKPVFHSTVEVLKQKKYKDQKAFAFAGIADPSKFFDTLESIGVDVVARQNFGDHHVFTDEECADLIDRSKQQELQLFTTEKDAARLKGMGEAQEKVLELSEVVRIALKPEDPAMLKRVFDITHKRFMARKKKIEPTE